MELETVSKNRCFGGTQGVYRHDSKACNGPMKLAVYLPPQAEQAERDGRRLPVLTWLSGLTCTEENFTVKAGAQRVAAELGLIVVAPDTSPRGQNIPGEDESYDFGSGAGFYLDATREPWSKAYNMYSYVTRELQALVAERFPVDTARQGIMGHSMGGHGALTIHLKNPGTYRSCSAFSPIVAPSQVPWGHKAFGGYLGEDRAAWRQYDATELVRERPSKATILIDQGEADNFLSEQLRPELFAEAARRAGQPFELRLQPGYDHSYFFIASFIEDHLRHHAAALKG
ncbi:S-formylglutathione hydrolase [Tistlia consotensis]|uniref:S-formylglutathione hydrolase n=1 Tax=Tistlia consotensis USBA 355 TaxID=560819 RepID=A0A1Y6BIF9_9PROT|nr:S-formylglutathione hydrolase [Tistlia consotensis]SMF13384.1 S-formylglutathione hydrolase [Tistlia consotensis USBA 355]SNR50533.1 S-formylglutathione hydrolase [Tistlia consotensis]